MVGKMKKLIYKLINKMKVFYNNLWADTEKSMLESCGENVEISKNSDLSPLENISVGNNVYMGPNTRIMTLLAKVKIGNDVMFGPGVTMITGNHRTDVIGRTMKSITNDEKLEENDQDIVVEDDVWIGANATILKGVTIGKGSVIAAGSLVTKSTPPYSISGGVPAKVLKMRFAPEEIVEHEKLLKGEK